MSSQGSRASSRSSLSSKATIESARSRQSSASTYSDNVRVIVRCRPLSENEASRGEDEVVHVDGDDTVRLVLGALGATRSQKKYRFNAVMGPACSQNDFFEASGVKALLESALDGYAATVFAYGQTGSGKTYSMSGYEEQIANDSYVADTQADGLIPRSMNYIFHRIKGMDCSYRLKASYCEIYNEQVFDLLNLTSTSLPVRWKPGKGFFVQDLFVVECQSLEDVMEVVCEGHRNRRVGSHEMNKDSSRSHSILTLYIESETTDPEDGHAVVKFGKIVFCDLAGSERLKDTKSAGLTLTETGAINKSLFTLSNVIAALSSPGASSNYTVSSPNATHIPYRDSKLTKLLMDSLGGSSLTLMICCCSPAATYAEETLSTLQYAHRASKIKNKPTIHLDGKEQLIARLREEIKLLKLENAYLREQVAGNTTIVSASSLPMSPLFPGGPETSTDRLLNSESALPQIGRSSSQTEHESSHLVPPGLNIPFGNSMPPSGPSSPSRSGKTSPKKASLMQRHQQAQIQAQQTYNQSPVSISATTSNHAMLQQLQQQQGNIDQMIVGFQREIQRLKSENREIRTREFTSDRNYQNAMLENERLTQKLEHLEEVFVHDSNLPMARNERDQLYTANARLQQQVEHLKRLVNDANSNRSEDAEPLRSENNYLRKVIADMKHRELALQADLQRMSKQSQISSRILPNQQQVLQPQGIQQQFIDERLDEGVEHKNSDNFLFN